MYIFFALDLIYLVQILNHFSFDSNFAYSKFFVYILSNY